MRTAIVIAIVVGLVAAWFVAGPGFERPPEARQWQSLAAPAPTVEHQAFVFDIVAEDEAELLAVLNRAETLAGRPGPQGQPPKVAIVLHGPEVGLFRIGDYERHKTLVDTAARLDALNLVDVKMCRRRMGMLGMQPADVPAFIEIVDFGPAEVERLKGEGYVES